MIGHGYSISPKVQPSRRLCALVRGNTLKRNLPAISSCMQSAPPSRLLPEQHPIPRLMIKYMAVEVSANFYHTLSRNLMRPSSLPRSTPSTLALVNSHLWRLETQPTWLLIRFPQHLTQQTWEVQCNPSPPSAHHRCPQSYPSFPPRPSSPLPSS